MAGIDASANLGGMLSQIGGTLGGMGQAGQGLMRPITMAFRPQVNMTDPESLNRQSQFFGSIGDTQQQELFANQAIIADKTQKEEQALQGKALISKINAGMENVMADPRLTTQQKQDTLAKLQVAADEAATRYSLDPTLTMNMARKLRSDYNALETQELNRDVMARAAARQAGLRDLFAAADSNDTERLEGLKKKLRANDFSDVVREYETADLEYKNAVAQNKKILAETGPLTEAELALAKQYGINETTLAAWKETPTLARTSLMRLSETVEKARFTSSASETLKYQIIQDYIPGVLRQLEREGEEWLDIFNKDVADLANEVMQDEEARKALAAAVKVAGATTENEIRAVVLSELSKLDSSVWQSMGWAQNAVDSYLGGRGERIIEVPDGKGGKRKVTARVIKQDKKDETPEDKRAGRVIKGMTTPSSLLM